MRIVPDSEELRRQEISEARQLAVAVPILSPMLESRKRMAFQRLMSAHRDGKPVDSNAIAELYILDGLQAEIRNKLENLNYKENK